MNRKEYLDLRRVYAPKRTKLIFVCESPPASGKYFYDPNGKTTEPLFRAMMLDVLRINPAEKVEGLTAFMEAGLLLVDATYNRVNKRYSKAERNSMILQDYRSLINDLQNIAPKRRSPLLLIKANVCRLLDARLTEDGFRALNKGRLVYFPSSGQQRKFRTQICSILSERPDLLP